ncbi:hypothetical protein ABH926_003306 [Catenulispora sp. GP43]|uniref:phosphotransferase n=1 Tax=Catenulispora sp. GP43 TaxID=3156263 RepID=UPI0035179E10
MSGGERLGEQGGRRGVLVGRLGEHDQGAPAAPSSIKDITPAWCTRALAPLIGPARVVSCTACPIGTGQVADTYRLHLVYDRPGAGPPSCVAKVPSGDRSSRVAAAVTRSYEIESGFYRDLAPTLPVSLPACHHSAFDAATGAYAVLLEDLAPARPVDQLVGCDADQLAGAVVELARLHGAHWADPGVAGLPWMPHTDRAGATGMAGLATASCRRFLRRYGDRLDPDVAELAERFPPDVAGYLLHRPGPRTVVHGDFRADNLMVRDGRITVVDWQTVAHEPGVTDLAYLLGGSVRSELRRELEDDMVRLYAEVLRGSGIAVTDGACWTDYRRYALGGLLMAIVASALVVRTERGDGMFAAMANRHGRHALDLDARALLPARL